MISVMLCEGKIAYTVEQRTIDSMLATGMHPSKVVMFWTTAMLTMYRRASIFGNPGYRDIIW